MPKMVLESWCHESLYLSQFKFLVQRPVQVYDAFRIQSFWILITYDVAAVKLGDDCSASQRFQSLFIHGSDVLGTCIIGIFRTSVLCLLLVTLLVRELVWQVHATRWSYFVILVKHPWSARGLVMYFFRQDWKLRVVVGLFDRRTWAGDLFPSLLCNILGVHVDRWRIPSATTGNYVLSWVCLTGGHDESVNSLAFLRMFVTVIPEISCWLTGGHDFYCLLVPHDVPSVWRRGFVCPFVSARPNSNCGFRELSWVS